jgi:hypothetical protein
MGLSMSIENTFVGAVAGVTIAKAEALQAAGTLILLTAQDRTPVDTGALVQSGRLTEVDSSTVAVSFGDDTTAAYDVIQHEDLDLNHPNGGQAKFLESAVNDRRVAAVEAMAAVIRTVIHG